MPRNKRSDEEAEALFGLGKAPYQNPYYRQMKAVEGDAIDLQIDYSGPNADDQETTFSREGIEQLELQFATFFGTRLMRFHEATGKGAKHAVIRVSVELQP